MDIKIQPGKTISTIDGTSELAKDAVQETAVASKADASDPITAIAMELVEGKIDTNQAVDLLIEQTMNVQMVSSAPPSLRAEVEQVLRSAIETDAHLVHLTQKLE